MNVLEAIDTEIKYLTDCGIVRGLAPFEQKRLDNLTASHAAVAELIEAHKALITFSWDWFSECIDDEDRFEERAAIKNARAALAKATP